MRDVASDTTAPVSSIACNGSASSSTAYTAPVSVSLSATDAGSGVDVIRYTLNGSDPTASSPSYSGPFTVSATTTVKYRAWDAGRQRRGDKQPSHRRQHRPDRHHATRHVDRL
jgi:Chitobiase/beta-hexosaminidase C-terminal domain